MMRIGLCSDTHGWWDPQLDRLFAQCDERWHAGDFGPGVAEQLEAQGPCVGVWGNIDDATVRQRFVQDAHFEREGVRIWMTHIGGYPGRYAPRIRAEWERLSAEGQPPDLFVCGHSHILKVQRDPRFGALTMNPGACGRHGFHRMRTALRFVLEQGRIRDLEVLELGPRSAMP
jgi:putative phosphoesterase